MSWKYHKNIRGTHSYRGSVFLEFSKACNHENWKEKCVSVRRSTAGSPNGRVNALPISRAQRAFCTESQTRWVKKIKNNMSVTYLYSYAIMFSSINFGRGADDASNRIHFEFASSIVGNMEYTVGNNWVVTHIIVSGLDLENGRFGEIGIMLLCSKHQLIIIIDVCRWYETNRFHDCHY